MNILGQGLNFGWSLCKAGLQQSGSFVTFKLAAKIGSVDVSFFNCSVRPYTEAVLGMKALEQLTAGITDLTRNIGPAVKMRNWRDTGRKLFKIAQNIFLLTHTYSPTASTSLVIGGNLLATGIISTIEGGLLIKEGLKSRIWLEATSEIKRRNLAQAIVLCGLGIWGIHSSLEPLTARLHYWQPLPNKMEWLRDRRGYTNEYICGFKHRIPLGTDSCYRSLSEFIYDPVVQKEFNFYCTDNDFALTSCENVHKYFEHKYMERRMPPVILSQLKASNIPSLEFVRELEILCETQQESNLCEEFRFFNGTPLYEKIIDTFKGINSLDSRWYQKLKGPNAASLISKIFKNQHPFNGAVILNGDDAPNAITYYGLTGSQNMANIYVEKVTNEQSICEILNNALAWNDEQPLDFITIKGHGSEDGIRLSNDTTLNTINVVNVANCFKKALAPGAIIALASCSTGRKRYRYLNIAERLAAETGHPVDAPVQNSRSVECSFLFPKIDSHGVTISSRGDILFDCIKTKEYDDDDEMTFGAYVKRFSRDVSDLDKETMRFDS